MKKTQTFIEFEKDHSPELESIFGSFGDKFPIISYATLFVHLLDYWYHMRYKKVARWKLTMKPDLPLAALFQSSVVNEIISAFCDVYNKICHEDS